MDVVRVIGVRMVVVPSVVSVVVVVVVVVLVLVVVVVVVVPMDETAMVTDVTMCVAINIAIAQKQRRQ